jgi:hypothetical protein
MYALHFSCTFWLTFKMFWAIFAWSDLITSPNHPNLRLLVTMLINLMELQPWHVSNIAYKNSCIANIINKYVPKIWYCIKMQKRTAGFLIDAEYPQVWLLSSITLDVNLVSLHAIRGARGSIVGWGNMLQAERSRVRSAMRSLDFSINLILAAALWPWGRLNL